MKINFELIVRAILISFILFVTGELILRTGGIFLLIPVVIFFLMSLKPRDSNSRLPWEDPSDWWKKGKGE